MSGTLSATSMSPSCSPPILRGLLVSSLIFFTPSWRRVDRAAAVLADHPEGGAELEPAVALRRAERVPGQALGVDARQRRLAPGELPLDEGRVLLLPAVLEDVDAEFSVDGGESRFRFVFYQGCHQR